MRLSVLSLRLLTAAVSLVSSGCKPAAPASSVPTPSAECAHAAPAPAARGAASPSPSPSPSGTPGAAQGGDEPLVIEAESMTLTAAEVVDAEGASGGKAVKLLSHDAVATIEVPLPRGQYLVNAYFDAADHDHDGFFLLADGKVKRTNAHHHKKWVYGAKFLIFTTDGSQPVTLKFVSKVDGEPMAESGMVVDRLELIELTRSAALLEHWTM